MENASKALLMAGGVLLSLILIGMLLLMFNNIGVLKKSQSSSDASSQIAEFNSDFRKYIESGNIYGADLVSLANKVIDFNNRKYGNGTYNYIDYSVKMTLNVTNMNNFSSKYGYSNTNNRLFKLNNYSITDDNRNNDLRKILDDYTSKDNQELKKLASIYKDGSQNNLEKLREELERIYGEDSSNSHYSWWPNTNRSGIPTLDNIRQYKEYDEFKTSTFECTGYTTDNKTGQMQTISFKFKE